MALTKVTYSMIQSAPANIVDFGAVSGADSTAAILAAIASGANSIYIPSGSYKYSSNITLRSDLHFFSDSGGTLVRTNQSRINTPATTEVAITAAQNLVRGDNYLVLGSADYAAINIGDFVRMTTDSSVTNILAPYIAASTSELNDTSDSIYQEQVFKVLQKVGSNTVVLDNTAKTTFLIATGNPGAVYKVSGVIQNVSFNNVTFQNADTVLDNNTEDAVINVYYVYNFNVENCDFQLNAKTGGIFWSWGTGSVNNCTFTDIRQLPIYARAGVHSTNITNNKFVSSTTSDGSVFIQAFCYNIMVGNNSFDGSRALHENVEGIAAIDLSCRANNITVTGNTVAGYAQGVRSLFGAMLNTITGNTFQDCMTFGVVCSASPANVISSNVFTNCAQNPNPTAGFYANNQATINTLNSEQLMINGNIIYTDTDTTQVIISGAYNYFLSNVVNGTGSIVVYAASSEIANNNITYDGTGDAITISGAIAGAFYNRITDNTIFASTANSAITLTSGTECNEISYNTFSTVGYCIFINTGNTSKAQSIYQNTNRFSNTTTSIQFSNTTITAPVMPATAILPRNFRIYEMLNPNNTNGQQFWEFSNTSGGSNRFQQYAYTITPVNI